ncbi:MAG: Fis family transcriptional regulator [Desulfobacterales bacterium RIFOXYA12_FULL_46_15]|nr:MAG: Fis family transcriptional regulator [Desulfobacula sp. GWF2_41_7]OGR22523.1 MAG: Fis family transcriptional regulator [Desulfobacterales bacterium RIFOXYA12_FULL_46_15]
MTVDPKEFFREATLRICGSLDIEKALHQCLLYIRQFIPVGQLGFHIYHRDAGIVETVAIAGPDSYEAISLKAQLSQKGRKQVEDQRSVRVRVIERLGDDPVTGPVAGRLDALDLSAIVMDLVLERKMLGVFSAFNNGRESFREEHVKLLSLLGKPCAIALTNSLRYRELENLKNRLTDDNRYFQEELLRMSGEDVIGAEQGLKTVMDMVRQVAPLESPVLLLGETGTGKEVVANTIHKSSLRKDGPFIKVNCGAMPPNLLDSELFGYEKGAFTGAVTERRGRIERAHGGTLFLDEIGELSAEAQVRLLRVLQEKEIDRVGGSRTIRVNIRIIAATHQDLDHMLEKKEFRPDLFFRLKVFPIILPPLRKRTCDIPALIHYFIEKKCQEMKRIIIPTPSSGAVDRLLGYSWPGNIRELENAVERSLILDQGDLLHFNEINPGPRNEAVPSIVGAIQPMGFFHDLDSVMRQHIMTVLAACNGRVEGDKGAARILGIHPSTLRKRMKKLKIPFGLKDPADKGLNFLSKK